MRKIIIILLLISCNELLASTPDFEVESKVAATYGHNKDSIKEKKSFVFFPQDQLYPVYIANPLRSTFSVQTLFFNKSTIANSGGRRFDLKLGGRVGVYRKTTAHRAWQFTLEGGFHGVFDRDHSEDNIGWDGIYAMSVDVRENEHFAWRLGLHHISSHIGDEIAERTGRRRVNYTRQEARAGLVWSFSPHWQSYAEAGWAYDFNNKVLQKHGRFELGIQFEQLRNFFDFSGFYSALDLSSSEESNWGINANIQLGIVFARDERRWRFGLEYYDGRSQLGEYFQDSEKYIGIGFWIDI